MADKILHNLPIDNNPSDSVKIAMGTESTPATNITLANFYNLLMGKLGFFKVSNLFSEIFGNASAMLAARDNIGVYGKDIVDSGLAQRAMKSNVIEKDSTATYTPFLPTHPVNKKYVDGIILFCGRTIYHDDNIAHTTITKLGGIYPVTGMSYGRPYGDFVHEFYHNLNISNYIPIIQIQNAMNRDNVVLGTVDWDNNKVSFKAETTDNFQDSVAKYVITLIRI